MKTTLFSKKTTPVVSEFETKNSTWKLDVIFRWLARLEMLLHQLECFFVVRSRRSFKQGGITKTWHHQHDVENSPNWLKKPPPLSHNYYNPHSSRGWSKMQTLDPETPRLFTEFLCEATSLILYDSTWELNDTVPSISLLVDLQLHLMWVAPTCENSAYISRIKQDHLWAPSPPPHPPPFFLFKNKINRTF